MSPSAGEVLGFENLVFSIFDFVHTLLENNKFKSTVKKALPDLIYYIILYMQITEEQVRTRPLPRELRPAPAASVCGRSIRVRMYQIQPKLRLEQCLSGDSRLSSSVLKGRTWAE